MAATPRRPRPSLAAPAVRRVGLVALAAVTLAGCATGNVRDAGPVATEAAQATNVIADIEATSVVEQFFDPTPTPLPYPTRLPVLAQIRLTSDVGDQNRPTKELGSVYNRGGPLYVAAQIAGVHPGQTVIASWRDASNNEVFSSSVSIGNDRELVWIPLQWDGAQFAFPGAYAVVVSVEGPGTTPEGKPDTDRVDIGSIAFQVV